MIWGHFFPGLGVTGAAAQQTAIKSTSAHSTGCNMLRLKEGELMVDLDPINQEFVLTCPHPSHESVKKLFVVICTGDRTEPEEGKLF